MEIRVELAHLEHEIIAYPACPKAEIFVRMLGNKKGLSREDLVDIQALGFTIILVSEPLRSHGVGH